MLVAGIEEAGRGPVIGPMVMVGVLVDEKDFPKLTSIGAKDSKLLTPQTREKIFDQILAMVKKYEIAIISSAKIDEALLSEKSNLNKLEGDTSAMLINLLKPDKAILDCPSNNPEAYADYIKKQLDNKKTRIVAEHKADVNYPVVSAASIIAKVIRDREIEKLKKKFKVDFGSGYPSDERTQKFLKENYKKYPFFRKTWASYKNVIEGKKQKHLGDF
jgi:ribonuclease HII